MKVLFIEDDPGDVEIITRHFENEKNFQLLTAPDLAKGILLAEKENIDVILSDLTLPDSEGMRTVQKLKPFFSKWPVIFLTGLFDHATALVAISEGAQDYLIKGNTDKEILKRSIDYSLERHRLLQQLQESRELERQLAYYDPLTHLPNRRFFYENLTQLLVATKRNQKHLALFFIDLDEFKLVNDTLGHKAGDFLLQKVAGVLKETLRESDRVSRLGGDEFTVILSDLSRASDAALVAEKIITNINQPFKLENHEFKVSASIGVSIFPEDGVDGDTLIKKADIAMYESKKKGKNQFHFFNPVLGSMVIKRFSIEDELINALNNKELKLYYQPRVSLKTGEILSVEALLRWQHPERGLLLPCDFIPIAEESGQIISIGDWVLETASRQIRCWKNNGFKGVLTVNVSPRQFLDRYFIQKFKKIAIIPESFGIEIQETCMVKDEIYTLKALDFLKSLGVKIQIDDFGTGFFSLEILSHLPIDTLIIPLSFLQGLPEDPESLKLIRTIQSIGANLKFKTVVKGIETEVQKKFISSSGFEEAQGFYFGYPVPAEKLGI